jgi:intraflagellar transport protein 81
MDLKVIIESLNAAPFSMALTLVDLHRKTPLELLQVVNDVFADIDSQQRSDLRDEAQEAMAHRMLEFVLILNYKHDMDISEFQEAFLTGRTNVVYPFLLWCLERRESLKKRAYLARYLKTVDIPEEYFADETVVSLFQNYGELQAEFKTTHREVEAGT